MQTAQFETLHKARSLKGGSPKEAWTAAASHKVQEAEYQPIQGIQSHQTAHGAIACLCVMHPSTALATLQNSAANWYAKATKR